MRLSKIYSNKPKIFHPIYFRQGLNVILAEIRLPENRNKDTHNLGKTLLGRLIDFLFLLKRDRNFFLFKNINLFEGFIFFLEIQLPDSAYLTVRRSVDAPTKISFKKHKLPHQDFIDLIDDNWDHFELAFENARTMLDSLLNWQAIKPWSYRNALGYQLRSQEDFQDVFRLKKFAGKHSDWKPLLAHILGFNAELITLYYKKEEELEKIKTEEKIIKSEVGDTGTDISKVEGLLLLKQNEIERKQKLLDAFDFRSPDLERTERLVNEIDVKIAALNAERYSLSHSIRKIQATLKESQILFNPSEAQELFEEAGIFFQGQILKDFEQLIAFNKAITDERRQYLQEEYNEIESRLKAINSELDALGRQRSEMLSFLSGTDVFEKYKAISSEIVILKADITFLSRQRDFLRRVQELRTGIRVLNEERTHLQTQIEDEIEQKNSDKASLFSSIRLFFSDFIEKVIDRKALLSVSTNNLGHLEFKVEILDESGNSTSADSGHTYRKLLCIAFDLAILRAHINQMFPRFVYHDGIFESLDDRKKENLLEVIRQYTDIGIQSIITTIDSDLPIRDTQSSEPVFDGEEIVLSLHDESDQGRLFKMPPW
jgi:uncharacterized protein YydD (DUF2326 family)